MEDALQKLSKNPQELKEGQVNAMKRLEIYATHICMKCLTPLLGEDQEHSVKSSGDNYFRLKIKFCNEEEEKELAKVDHLICRKCVDKILRADSERKAKGAHINIPPAIKIIDCTICEDEHQVDIREWNAIFKKNCCSSCIIY